MFKLMSSLLRVEAVEAGRFRDKCPATRTVVSVSVKCGGDVPGLVRARGSVGRADF